MESLFTALAHPLLFLRLPVTLCGVPELVDTIPPHASLCCNKVLERGWGERVGREVAREVLVAADRPDGLSTRVDVARGDPVPGSADSVSGPRRHDPMAAALANWVCVADDHTCCLPAEGNGLVEHTRHVVAIHVASDAPAERPPRSARHAPRAGGLPRFRWRGR